MGGVADYSGATVYQIPTQGLSTLCAVCEGVGGAVCIETRDESVEVRVCVCVFACVSACVRVCVRVCKFMLSSAH